MTCHKETQRFICKINCYCVQVFSELSVPGDEWWRSCLTSEGWAWRHRRRRTESWVNMSVTRMTRTRQSGDIFQTKWIGIVFLHLQSTQIHAWMSGIGNPRYCLLCEQLDLALLVWLRLANLNKEKFSKNFCPDLQWVELQEFGAEEKKELREQLQTNIRNNL